MGHLGRQVGRKGLVSELNDSYSKKLDHLGIAVNISYIKISGKKKLNKEYAYY